MRVLLVVVPHSLISATFMQMNSRISYIDYQKFNFAETLLSS